MNEQADKAGKIRYGLAAPKDGPPRPIRVAQNIRSGIVKIDAGDIVLDTRGRKGGWTFLGECDAKGNLLDPHAAEKAAKKAAAVAKVQDLMEAGVDLDELASQAEKKGRPPKSQPAKSVDKKGAVA